MTSKPGPVSKLTHSSLRHGIMMSLCIIGGPGLSVCIVGVGIGVGVTGVLAITFLRPFITEMAVIGKGVEVLMTPLDWGPT